MPATCAHLPPIPLRSILSLLEIAGMASRPHHIPLILKLRVTPHPSTTYLLLMLLFSKRLLQFGLNDVLLRFRSLFMFAVGFGSAAGLLDGVVGDVFVVRGLREEGIVHFGGGVAHCDERCVGR